MLKGSGRGDARAREGGYAEGRAAMVMLDGAMGRASRYGKERRTKTSYRAVIIMSGAAVGGAFAGLEILTPTTIRLRSGHLNYAFQEAPSRA